MPDRDKLHLMNDFIVRMIPIVVFFLLGYVFKRLKLFRKEDGSVLLNLVFYLTMPALTFSSLFDTPLDFQLLYLPFIPLIIMIFTYLIGRLFLSIRKYETKTAGTFLIGSMIMNTGFTLGFFHAGFGSEGFTKAILFDLGNSFLIFTWVYFIAVKAGAQEGHSKMKLFKKIFLLPPLWALILAIALKESQIKVPDVCMRFFDIAGQPTIPLIMLALGLYFEPALHHLKRSFAVISIRMFGGLLISLLLIKFFSFDLITSVVIIGSSAAPVGYNTLVFSGMEDLDKDFAASVVSLSILLGMIFVPVLFYFIAYQ